ncbi:MAG TPA: hypothetical protein VF189_05130 [Patescibacteria group bacterium]
MLKEGSISELSFLTSFKRKVAAKSVSNFFPYSAEASYENLDKINKFLDSGTGLIFVTPHIDRGDFLRVFETAILCIPKLRRRKMIVPIAAHQIHSTGIKQILDFTDIDYTSVVTKKTIRKQELSGTGDFKGGEGNREYAKKATDVIKEGGAIFVSPQAERKASLDSWENNGRPIRTTDTFLRRGGAENFAYVFLGIEKFGFFGRRVSDYSKINKMNPFKIYKITIGDILTSEELRNAALENNNTLDEEARQRMLKIAPKAYKPQS